jgi:hypothetical protein
LDHRAAAPAVRRRLAILDELRGAAHFGHQATTAAYFFVQLELGVEPFQIVRATTDSTR